MEKKFDFEEFKESTVNPKDTGLKTIETKEPIFSKMFTGKVFGAEDAFDEDFKTSVECSKYSHSVLCHSNTGVLLEFRRTSAFSILWINEDTISVLRKLKVNSKVFGKMFSKIHLKNLKKVSFTFA